MKDSLIMSGTSNSGRWCAVTVAVSLNLALLISSIGIGLYISINLQDNQHRMWDVSRIPLNYQNINKF